MNLRPMVAFEKLKIRSTFVMENEGGKLFINSLNTKGPIIKEPAK